MALLGCCGFLCLPSASAREPARIIFDTDMGNDVDDALALAVLHALESRGECRLLAVTLTNPDPLAGPFVDAVNTFYGRGNIPIGVRRDGATNAPSRFLPVAQIRDGRRLRYSHDLNPRRAPEARALLRQTLAAQPDASVTLVQVGFSSTLAGLLDASADVELVRRKVKLLCVMGGAFRPIDGNPRFAEFNIVGDLGAARRLARDWPTPIVWSGFEIGVAVCFPAASVERDFSYVAHHIIAEAYRAYEPPPHERPLWDLTAVLFAVRPESGYFKLSPPGRVSVAEDGATVFEAHPVGRDRFLVLPPEAVGRVREALVQLVTQPPCICPGRTTRR
ncbi:MAG: nucleoside hydrolase [Verrucomicrobiales bacterium]|nr:nucleoside hydrolase [Verrucomicrobiales bacterium]